MRLVFTVTLQYVPRWMVAWFEESPHATFGIHMDVSRFK